MIIAEQFQFRENQKTLLSVLFTVETELEQQNKCHPSFQPKPKSSTSKGKSKLSCDL